MPLSGPCQHEALAVHLPRSVGRRSDENTTLLEALDCVPGMLSKPYCPTHVVPRKNMRRQSLVHRQQKPWMSKPAKLN